MSGACHSHGFGFGFGSNDLIVGLAVVLQLQGEGKPGGLIWYFAIGVRTVNRISLVEICFCGCLRDVFLDVISVIVAIGSGQLRYEWAPPQVTKLCSNAFTGRRAGNGEALLVEKRSSNTFLFNS
ncbi:hypothetical protein Tco_0121980 [Tanacetum coccineum]